MLILVTFALFILALYFYYLDSKLDVEQQPGSWQYGMAEIMFTAGLITAFLFIVITIFNHL